MLKRRKHVGPTFCLAGKKLIRQRVVKEVARYPRFSIVIWRHFKTSHHQRSVPRSKDSRVLLRNHRHVSPLRFNVYDLALR